MNYAIVYHTSILDGTTHTEVWDRATVAMAERYAPGWEVQSWHVTRADAELEASND